MSAIFTQSFRMQTVEKALCHSSETSLREIAEGLGVGKSTLNNWIVKSRIGFCINGWDVSVK